MASLFYYLTMEVLCNSDIHVNAIFSVQIMLSLKACLSVILINIKYILNNNPRDQFTTIKIVSEYDQKIPQSQTADNHLHHEEEPLNHHKTPGRITKQNNQLSSSR